MKIVNVLVLDGRDLSTTCLPRFRVRMAALGINIENEEKIDVAGTLVMLRCAAHDENDRLAITSSARYCFGRALSERFL